MDFEQLATISRRAAVGAARRRYLRIGIPELSGAMHRLLEALPDSVSIADFQYGKTHAKEAHPVIGFDVDPMQFDVLKHSLRNGGYAFSDVTTDTDVGFRMINYAADLISHSYFITLEFHERPGALAEFLSAVSPHSNRCYFNYAYTGERVGRALLGFEFEGPMENAAFTAVLNSAAHAYRAYERVSEEVMQRILS